MAAYDLFCCLQHPLRVLTVTTPSSNTTCQDTFYGIPVECDEIGSPHVTQEVEIPLCFLEH